MRDDDVMDQLLKEVMAADAPQLSPAFELQVMRRVRPRRLSTMGRVIMAVYIVAAAATAVLLMRELPIDWIVASVIISATVAAGASAYGRRFVLDH